MDLAPIFDVSCGHSHVDGESSGSEISLDEELGIPLVVTPRDRLRYDCFLAHHYAYMVEILEE